MTIPGVDATVALATVAAASDLARRGMQDAVVAPVPSSPGCAGT
jgi:hypothetical protein